MTKAILFDADGVVLKRPGYFSEKFSKEYGVPLEIIVPFFKNEFRVCQLGQTDLKEILPPFLEAWGWKKSVEEFLNYWFSFDVQPDEKVLGVIKDLRDSGTKCYLASDQEKYRAEYLLETAKFNQVFDGCYFSYELGVSKSDKTFFEKVLQDLGCIPSELIYFDDDQKNVDVAKALGIDARLYHSFEQLKQL